MDNDWVQVTEKYFRQPDGNIRMEIWAEGGLVYESMMMHFWQSVTGPHFWMPIQDPWSAVSCIDGSCIATALVKEGPKAMVLYGR